MLRRRRNGRRIFGASLIAGFLLLAVRGARAQEGVYSLPTEKHARELAITSGFATDLPGGAKGGNYWTAQLRLGRVLIAPRALRGALEVAMELEPAILLHQNGFIYGAGQAMLLQWNVATAGKVKPFLNAGSGVLLTSAKFPRGTSHFNFTPQGGIGVYVFTSSTRAWVAGVRYHHTSNAGLARFNPGHNALYFHAGISWWR